MFASRSPFVAALVAFAALVAAPGRAWALPDLVPEVFDLQVKTGDVLAADVTEGCAGGQYHRRLVSFSMRTKNIGADDLALGNPGCPNCALNPGAPCTNPLYVCGTAHGHAHFQSFARNEILDADGNVVAEGRKFGFCLLDLNCPTPHYSCSFQGITAGCSDVYSAGLPCQYVDITDDDLPDGRYTLRVTIDPLGEIPESDETNNVVEVPFTVGPTPQVCPVYQSTDVPLAIPDQGSVTSTLTVPDIGPVKEIRVRLNGTHTYLGDLDAKLTSPAGTPRTMFSQICGQNDDFRLYLGDEAEDPLVCPATDDSVLRTPAQSLAPFVGQEAGGQWTLTVTDHNAGDTGTLDSWSLEICSICGNGLIDPGEACDDGNVRDGDCCSSDCTVAYPDGTSCEDGNACTTNETCEGGQCIEHGTVECDACLVCDPDQGCVVPDLVYPCQAAPRGASVVQLRYDQDDPGNDQLTWKWRSQTPVELDEFGAPDILSDISICIYDGAGLLLSSTVPAASTCDGGAPCWVRGEHSATFFDRALQFDGLTSIRIREGKSGRIVLKGDGPGLGLPGLYPQLPMTVRMRRNDGTPCWEAVYDTSRENSDQIFKARSH